MKLASFPLQVAVFDRLNAALSIPVYEGEAERLDNGEIVDPPYVVIGEGTTTADWVAKRSPGTQETLTIHVWCKGDQGGYRDCKRTMSEITELLTDEEKRLTMGGFFVSGTSLELAETMTDPDGSRHGILRFRFWIHQR